MGVQYCMAYRTVPILAYHKTPRDFADQIDLLLDEGYSLVNLKEIRDYLERPEATAFPEKKAVITFDDAFMDFFKAQRILEERGLVGKATLAVPMSWVSLTAGARFGGPRSPTMTWKELRKLKDKGYEIIAHSVTHRPHDQFDTDHAILEYEMAVSRTLLKTQLGLDELLFYCLPGGAGWGKELVSKTLQETGFVGALRAQYGGEEWDRYSIPRCCPIIKQHVEGLLENFRFP